MDDIIEVRDGYDRRKSAPLVKVRSMTFQEAVLLRSGDHCSFISITGELRNLKINGQVKRWKRDVNRIEIPIKYGMYEFATFYLRSDGKIGNNDGAYLVVEV